MFTINHFIVVCRHEIVGICISLQSTFNNIVTVLPSKVYPLVDPTSTICTNNVLLLRNISNYTVLRYLLITLLHL